MSMKSLDELRDMLCDELDELTKKGELGAGELEIAHKLTDTIKNIDKICIMDEEGGYSQAGDWEARGRFGYDGGNSYAGRRRDGRGRYSRDDGRDYPMNGRRYSRDNGKESMMEHIDMMMEEADGPQKDIIRRFKKQLQEL